MLYTPEILKATLDCCDQQIKQGIIEGDIHNVMAIINPEIVCDLKKIK